MEINLTQRVRNALDNSLRINARPSFNRVIQGFSSPQNLGAFFKYLKVDLSNPKDLYIPTMYRALIETLLAYDSIESRRNALNTVGGYMEENIVYLPLIFNRSENIDCRREVRRTSDAIINNTFVYTSGLKAIITSKDVEYNIGNGIILDKEFNPLLVLGVKAFFNKDENMTMGEIFYNDFLIRVSPSAFLNKDMLSRYIINKIIPYYTNTEMGVRTYSSRPTFRTDRNRKLPIVEVSYMDDLFFTPKKKLSEDISKDINDFLVDNLGGFEDFLQ